VRDRWGIPHIYAQNDADLFFAQGFVQAQDRLFQLDLWRRSVQGRLSEVLGPNFIERDAMTRRMQYTGSMDAEWASYAPDAQAIASAFVRGVNACVAIARRRLPEEFVLAGWAPEFWTPADLLSRVEAFGMSDNAMREVFRARLVNALGAARAAEILPLDPPVPLTIPRGLDTHAINFLLGDALRRIGTAPFFMSLATPVAAGPAAPARAGSRRPDGSNNWVVSAARTGTGAPLVANDPHRALDHPSLRYLVHLNAPGWNVIGAVVPWFPGVAIGHNEHVAWGLTIFSADVQDLYVEQTNPVNPHQVKDGGRWVDTTRVHDTFPVKGRDKPFEFDREYTRHGVVVAVDKVKHLAFALRWTGAEPGTAGYLAGLSLDRARSADEFRAALTRWKMPGENFVFADRDGRTGYQAAALVPRRSGWNGTLPVPGWTGAYEWRGWLRQDELPHAANPADGYFATANNRTVSAGNPPIGFDWSGPARINRIREVFEASPQMDVAQSRALQLDVQSWNAGQLVPLLSRITGLTGDAEQARGALLQWDRRLTLDSTAAMLYVLWERALGELLAQQRLPPPLVREFADNADQVLVPALTAPSRSWFDGDLNAARDALVSAALSRAAAAARQQAVASGGGAWGRVHTATFRHVLGITAAGRERFDIGPFARPGYGDTVNATWGPALEQTEGASFREILDLADWDRSIATSAPGQSESPSSPHFADLARRWAAGEYFPLAFSGEAVRAAAEATLVLHPAGTPKP